ncbi:MAG: arginine--tRNA ligase [Magnetovibrionaceae bacterium]
MNVFAHFRTLIVDCLKELGQDGSLPTDLETSRISTEPPRDAAHGDIATNAAMVLAKQAKMKPRDIAELLVGKLAVLTAVESADVAGPGFINLKIAKAFWSDRVGDILEAGVDYGTSRMGGGKQVNVEYVSANPTGPMHVGHARGAVVGDALSALLEKAGFAVSREYWINDAGAQVDVLARSAYLRYAEALGQEISIPDGLYPGDYLIPVGKALADAEGDKWLDQPEDVWLEPVRDFAVDAMMDLIRDDLAALGVEHAVFTSERGLVDAGKVDDALRFLEERGHIYVGVLEPPKGKTPDDWEPRPQTLFRATEFGDDVDRALKKSDGSWTYFATDIAYHLNKVQRGFPDMINIWGADHGGYVKRLQAAVRAVSEGEGSLDVKLCQMVNLMDNGEPMKMSKRAGTFVTLRDLIDAVGKDVVRFIMLTRKNDAQMDFDLTKAKEQSRDNPVFYVQYAHARCHSVLRHASEEFGDEAVAREALKKADLHRLMDEAELDLIKQLAAWPRVVEAAAEAHEPHRVAFYLNDVAASFHGLWNKGKDESTLRFILTEDQPLTFARLALLQAVIDVVASGLGVFGVTPVKEMR